MNSRLSKAKTIRSPVALATRIRDVARGHAIFRWLCVFPVGLFVRRFRISGLVPPSSFLLSSPITEDSTSPKRLTSNKIIQLPLHATT